MYQYQIASFKIFLVSIFALYFLAITTPASYAKGINHVAEPKYQQPKRQQSKDQISNIQITDAWTFATNPQSQGAVVYMTITNHFNTDDALVKVTSPLARKVEIHRTYIDEHGAINMRKMKKIILNRQSEVVLKAGDLHLMLMGLKQQFKVGFEVPLRLEFENSRARSVRVKVETIHSLKSKAKTNQ